MRAVDIPQIAGMSTPERILLVADLWDSVVPHESNVPVPENHLEELGRRLPRHESHPGRLLTLEELQARIDRRQ
jgi:putative addiction module component (TIGR02574 family)